MKLVGFNPNGNRLHLIRDLSEDEIANHEKFITVFTEARSRFHLFKILGRNYTEWISYINLLLNPLTNNDDDAMLQLDRLLLNYLSCAYTIHEHFKTSFRRRFRKNEEKLKEYDAFIEALCAKSWEFAFFLDFRGYVQHCGLGTSNFNRQRNLTSVTLQITQDAAQLVEDSKEWKRSKLTGKEGQLELAKLLQEFHHRMLATFGGHVAKIFFPDLFPAAKFYSGLTNEAKKIDGGFRMFFIPDGPEVKTEGDKQKMNLTLSCVPNEVFTELGISISS